MARLFTAGFENGTDHELTAEQATSVSSTVRRTGTYSLKLNTNANYNFRGRAHCSWLTSTSEIYVRVGTFLEDSCFYPGTQNYGMLQFRDSNGDLQLRLNWNDGLFTMDLYDGAKDGTSENTPGNRLAAGSIALKANTWIMIEINLVVGASGSFTMKINGTTSIAYSGDTDYTGAGDVQQIIFRAGYIGGALWESYLDDIAINDTSGSYQDSWAGLGGIFYLKPTADGTVEWTPSAGTLNYAMVDDIPPDNATTYVQAVANGDRDLYEIEDCPQYINTVNLLEVYYEAALVTSGYNEVTDVVSVAGTVYSGSERTIVPITPAFELFKGTTHYVSPNTGIAWATAEINAMWAGMEITV